MACRLSYVRCRIWYSIVSTPYRTRLLDTNKQITVPFLTSGLTIAVNYDMIDRLEGKMLNKLRYLWMRGWRRCPECQAPRGREGKSTFVDYVGNRVKVCRCVCHNGEKPY